MLLHKRNRKLHIAQKGFTLVELVVTLTVIAIVMSLTAMGILAWMDWSTFQKENEYAQTLFIAAQNQLSEYAANGRLTEMMDSLAGGSYEDAVLDENRSEIFCQESKYGMNLTGKMDRLTDSQGNVYDLETVFPQSQGKGSEKTKYQDEIVSLRAEAGDYERYLDNPKQFKADDPEAYWVFELLGSYVYDKTILNGTKSGGSADGASICVEFTPRGGQVFSVLYTDKANQFIYLGLSDAKGSEEAAGVFNISDRQETYRRDRKIGYYGVDTLYASTENKMVRPGISYVKLYNKETFYLIAKLAEKSKPLIGKMEYEIDLDASKDANDKKLTIKLDGTKLKNAESTTAPIECPVYRYEYKDDGTGKHVLTKIEMGTLPIMAWIEAGAVVHVVYDAADIQATTYRYESELDVLRSETANAAAGASFSDTYSFFRFALDADDVYATIKGKAEGYADTKQTSNFGNINPTKNQTGKNPCFASFRSEEKDGRTNFRYTLLNERHLYNIRYIEDISYEKEVGGYPFSDEIGKVEFILKSDLDFAKFQAEGNLYSSDAVQSKVDLKQLNDKIYTLKDNPIGEVTRFNCEFPTFKQLRANDSFDGGNKKLKGILSSELSDALYMIYLDPNSATAPMAERKPIGLFNVNYGKLENLYMDDFSVKGSDMVGSFCGINAGQIDNLTTLNTNHVSRVSGVKNVGGIMGFLAATDDSAEITGLTNRADVYGTEAVGGIVGMVRNNFKDYDFTNFALTVDQLNALKSAGTKSIKIEKCSNYGPVFGFAKKDLKGVYVQSTGSKKAKAAVMPDDDPEKIRYVGGIVGYCYNADEKDMDKLLISECISSPQYTGENLNVILSDRKKLFEKLKGDYVGGIAGYNYYGTIRSCSTKAERGTAGCIFGYRYVGGIVGLNIGPSSGIIGGDVINKGINENHVVGCYYVGGITGANATVKDEALAYDKVTTVKSKDPEILSKSDAILEPSSERSLEVKVENWTNKGVIIATKEYAGGITGFNAGWIYKCFSEVSASSVDEYFKTMLSNYDLGDYCGGIAGYNNGIIGNTDRTVSADKKSSKTKGKQGSLVSADVYVNGHNYVGGIVGYNDVDSIVEDYQVTSGYVRGYAHRFEDDAKSCFVGGYAGLNSSVDLLMNLEPEEKEARFIHSNPNQVKGDYFVGGTIGGNMINTGNFNSGATIPNDDHHSHQEAASQTSGDVTAEFDCKEAVFTTWTNLYQPSADGVNPLYEANLVIRNDSDKSLSCWNIDLSGIENLDDIDLKTYYGLTFDKANKVLTYTSEDGAIAPHSQKTINMGMTSETKEPLQKLLSSKWTVRFFSTAENQIGQYGGVYNGNTVCEVSFGMDGYVADLYNTNATYSVRVKPLTDEVYPNLRIEFDLPDSASYAWGTTGDYSIKDNVLAFKKSHLNGNGGSEITYQFNLNFTDAADIQKFAASVPRVSFNNVLYSGTLPGNGTGGSTGTPGTPGTPSAGKDILAQYKTDNFLGILDGREFVGGYIGYNLLLENDDKEAWVAKDADGDRGAVYVLQKRLLEAFAESDNRNLPSSDSLASKKSILDDLNTCLSDKNTSVNVKKSPSQMLISGKGTEATKTEFGSIYGEIYVGGVLGYNDDETQLTVKNVENATPIFARSAIEYKSEQIVDGQFRTTNYIGEDRTYTYSYAGGIIGKVSKNTVVDHCWNSFSGSVSTKGTYTGGLCEINEGTVKNCDVSNFGSGVDDYLGGICGLNKETGTIENCRFENKTVSGRNVVGGIAAENFGKIKQIKLTMPKIRASALATGSKDGVVGLFSGYNGLTGDIELYEDLQTVSVKSDGCYAGAVTGVNEGSITNLKTNSDDIVSNLFISGNIEGYYDVGALVGLNKDPDKNHAVSNYTNKATIISLNGNAGGIVGENASANTIRYCVNDAVVSATVGNAGGIVSVNTGEISNCYGYKTVSAPKGMSGGITAINGDKEHKDANIFKCYVGPDKSGSILTALSDVTFVSTESVGGIAAVNYGVIEENVLEHVVVTNIGTIMHTSIGVVAGDNAAGGRIYLKGNAQNIKNCQAIAKTNNCNVGGIAGTNDGLIANKESYQDGSADTYGYAVVGAEVKLDGASYSSLGGIAGLNTGTIAYCQVDTQIAGMLGTEKTGYGGIAGYSGYNTQAEYIQAKQTTRADDKNANGENIYRARIIGCTFDGSVSAPGSAGNPANIGGITGVNGYGGYIEDCALGVRAENLNGEPETTTSITSGDISKPVLANSSTATDTKAYAYIGGVAGRNYAMIRNVDMQPKSTDEEINVIAFAGAVGGMVGFEYPGASVCGERDKDTGTIKWTSTPSTMLVEMKSGENDYGAGGVIGYRKSGMPVSYVRNFAHVKNYVNLNVKTGGIIGTLEQQKVICVDFTNCENYGLVEGLKQVGGLIGRSKFCAIRMTDCANYGEVYAEAGIAGGIIACIYDIQKAECYFTGCNNHGYVHTGKLDSSNVLAGGLIGSINGRSSLTTYIYDCDNTGIVECKKKSEPDESAVSKPTQNYGSFVGKGTGSTWYFEQCQNYGISKCTNGFIGVGDGACIMRFKDCLDNSNSKTTLAGFSPFIGSYMNGNAYSNDAKSTGKSTFRNVYYLDQNSVASEERFTKAAGAYFTFDRVTNFNNFYYQGRLYQNLKNPALYLTAPSEHTYMRIPNNSSLELHVAYDKAKCAGIRDFNVYFWNGKIATQTTGEAISRTVQAVFTDIDGKTETVTEKISNLNGKNWLGDKITLTVPAGLKPEIRDIKLTFTGGECCLHGFTYTPAGGSKEAACTYIGEKNDTAFSLVSIKNNGAAKAVNPNGIVTHSISSFDDLLGLEFYKTDAGSDEFFRYDRTGNGGVLDIDFDVQNGPDASGMDSFVFILGTGNDKDGTKVRQYCADYRVTFTDIYDNEATVTGTRADGTGAIGYHSTHAKCMDGTVVKVPDGLDKRIKHVRVSITDLVRWWTEPGTDADMTKAPTLNQSYVFLRGFRWIPVGSTQAEYLGVGSRPAKGVEEYVTPACITRLFCDYSKNPASPYVFTENDYSLGFQMTGNDPINAYYYDDKSSYGDSNKMADGSNSRIKVYQDVHPKFIQMIQEIYSVLRKLDTPVLTIKEANGRFVVSWEEISNAYSYEVKYEIKDETGKVVQESELYSQGAGSQTFTIPISENWRGHRIKFYVRAVNAYRYTGNDTSYDSDWGTAETAVKDALIQPVVHAELTAGNKMVMILDNRDDYMMTDGSYRDCNINITYGDVSGYKTYKFNIPVADGFVSDTAEYIDGWNIGGDYNLTAIAQPATATTDIYSDSIPYYLSGHLVCNSSMLTTDQYVPTWFRGFYGNQADQMTYDVYFTAGDGRDCYVRSDIIAYDKTIGEEVAYSSMQTHVASVYGGANFTASLSDLPKEWFSEDFESPIIAREYLYRSQYEIVHYGHLAAADVRLDGATPEENQAILATVRDPYYLSADDSQVLVENAPIWENGALKPGYTLQLKQDEYGGKIYDIYYNAGIELAIRAAEEKNAALTGNAEYVYYKNCVDYKLYTADKLSATLVNSGSTNLSAEKTYGGVNTDDYQETYLVRNYKDNTQLAEAFPASNNNNNTKIQEMQPAPIIDEVFKDDPVDGHRSYTFTFDEYYKDAFCMTLNNTKNANTWYTSTDTMWLTQADDSVAATWAAFAAKTGYYTETNASRKRRIMNAYYYSYLNAAYRVELIGTTLAGEEAVIKTADVTAPTRLEDKTKTYDINGKPYTATYECYNYQVTFTDTDDIWNNYSKFTVRVMRLGEKNSITYGKNVPDISKITGANNSMLRLPRYSDYRIHVKMKLNTVNNPTAGLHKEDSSYVMDNLTYDVTFGAITNQDQIRDLGGYLIKVEKVLEPGNVSGDTNVHYYYVKDFDNTIENNDIGINPTLLAASGIVKEIDNQKEYVKDGNSRTVYIDLSDYETNDNVRITVKAIASTKAENYMDGDEGNEVLVEILERLKVPDVSCLTVDDTRGMKDISTLGSTATEDDAYTDSENYQKGMYFVHDPDKKDPVYMKEEYGDVRMKMSAAVYNDCTNKTDVSKVKEGDEGTGVWNDRAVETLFTKKEALELEKVGAYTRVNVDLVSMEKYRGQFAGRWLKIAMKATSASRIDSPWTDQDSAEKNTLNYRWVHIPKLKLPDVELKDDSEDTSGTQGTENVMRYYYKRSDGTVTVYDSPEDIPNPPETASSTTRIYSQTLAVTEDKCADVYDFMIVQAELETTETQTDGNGKKETVYIKKIPRYRLVLQKHLTDKNDPDSFDGTWDADLIDLSLTSTSSDGTNWDAWTLTPENKQALWTETKNLGKAFEDANANPAAQETLILPLTEIWSKMGTDQGTENAIYTVSAQLRYESVYENGVYKSGAFKLVLPDITKIEETDCSGTASYLPTQEVMVRTYIKTEANANYKHGNAAVWQRTSEEMKDSSNAVIKDGKNNVKHVNIRKSLDDTALTNWYKGHVSLVDPYATSGAAFNTMSFSLPFDFVEDDTEDIDNSSSNESSTKDNKKKDSDKKDTDKKQVSGNGM